MRIGNAQPLFGQAVGSNLQFPVKGGPKTKCEQRDVDDANLGRANQIDTLKQTTHKESEEEKDKAAQWYVASGLTTLMGAAVVIAGWGALAAIFGALPWLVAGAFIGLVVAEVLNARSHSQKADQLLADQEKKIGALMTTEAPQCATKLKRLDPPKAAGVSLRTISTQPK